MAAKANTSPGARDYCWMSDNGNYLDPTDADGKVSNWPGPGTVWFFPVDTTLSRVNEAPVGIASTNVMTEDVDRGNGIAYIASRDIFAGEEVYVDYGQQFDRSTYTL
jgi:hypothetical protein